LGSIRPRGAIVGQIATAQHGRITAAQLLDAGVDRDRIKHWVADGRLRRVHTGVYAVGHAAPSADGDYMAAVLAGGEGAVLSHRAAAHLLRLLPGAPPPPEVTVPTTAHRRRPGIVIHRVKQLHPLDASSLDGIPVTTVPRVLLDLAPRLAPALLARAGHEAWIRHRTGPQHVESCIARNPRKPGAAKLRRALGADVTLSVLEDARVARRAPPALGPRRLHLRRRLRARAADRGRARGADRYRAALTRSRAAAKISATTGSMK
jgi:hypothetical protein